MTNQDYIDAHYSKPDDFSLLPWVESVVLGGHIRRLTHLAAAHPAEWSALGHSPDADTIRRWFTVSPGIRIEDGAQQNITITGGSITGYRVPWRT